MLVDMPRIIFVLSIASIIALVVGATLQATRQTRPASAGPIAKVSTEGPWQAFQKPPKEHLQKTLSELQYRVTQEEGTERPFSNTFWDNKEPGLYVDIVSGEPLFSSTDMFASGTGWPSFVRPLAGSLVREVVDTRLGMRRVEVRSAIADSHLGHVFDDGPEPTGLRYCINSAALDFIPVDQLEEKGYGNFMTLFTDDQAPSRTETATLAGGCFWGMEDIIRDIPGVIETEVGYTGGTVKNATYGDLKGGKSGHAEAVQVIFDPDKVSYEEILGFFFRMHDPTTLNRQGNDRGSQYRSAIFAHDDTQAKVAARVKAEVDASGKWKKPIVTEIVAAGPFYPAEDYHQDYLEKNPNGYTCHFLRD